MIDERTALRQWLEMVLRYDGHREILKARCLELFDEFGQRRQHSMEEIAGTIVGSSRVLTENLRIETNLVPRGDELVSLRARIMAHPSVTTSASKNPYVSTTEER